MMAPNVILGLCIVVCVFRIANAGSSRYHEAPYGSPTWRRNDDVPRDIFKQLFHSQFRKDAKPPTRELQHARPRIWRDFESVDPPTWRASELLDKKFADPPTIRERDEPPTLKSEILGRSALPPTIRKRGRETRNYPSLEEQACGSGMMINCEKGTVASLGYPDAYPPNVTCTWFLEAPKGQVVEVDFTDFALQKGDCVTLSYHGSAVDYIYNPAVELCGDHPPKKFTSVGNELQVMLTTDGAGAGRGILFDHYARDPVECEDVIEIQAESGTLSSKSYPKNYQPQANCTWRIIGPPNTTVTVSFSNIGIEHARSCEYDVVILYDGPATTDVRMGAYCGHSVPKTVTSTSNVVLVVLTSDSSSEDVGFELTWKTSGNV